jgi:hypothetical protein
VEIRKSFLEQADLELRIVVGPEQVIAHHGLVEVGRHLCGKQGVTGIDHRLVFPGQIGMHRVTEFMRNGAHAEDRIVVLHHDERIRSFGAGGELRCALVPIWVNVHPAFLQ